MATPYLIADSAQVTVLRSLASTAFGKYGLKLPEGVDLEDVYEVAAPGNELAYVSSLGSKRRVGGMFRRFVRADVNVTAQGEGMVPASDVERVLDEAAKRVSGDFFLESDISKAGLGPWVPFVDFHVGDIANVEIWGRVVPLVVTRIEPKRTEHSDNDWSVHVGGQLLSDSEARLAENADIYNAVVSDRRDIAGVEAKASQAAAAASSAQSTADAARGEVAAVRDTLAGEQSGEPDLLAQLVAVNDELQRLGQSPQPSLMLAFVSLSTALWEAQQKWNRERETIDSRQDAFDTDLQEQIRTMEAIHEEAERRRPRPVFAKFSEYKDGYVDPEGLVRIEPFSTGDRGFAIQCLGEWTGTMVVRATAIAPLSANSIDSVRADVSVSQRLFRGVPEAIQMSYNTLDLTIFPD